MALTPARYEPQSLASGDSISFTKNLPRFAAADGWALQYQLILSAGGQDPIVLASVPATDGMGHLITVPAATTATWVPGEYDLEGFAINAGTGERIQVYASPLTIFATPSQIQDQADTRTFAQRMVDTLQATMLKFAANDIEETTIEGVHYRKKDVEKLNNLYAYWFRVRQNEIDGERARSGLPSRNKIRPFFNVKTAGPTIGYGYPFGIGAPPDV